MTANTFNSIVKEQLERCKCILMRKADEYAIGYATEDRLYFFKTAAVVHDETPIKSLASMMIKHTISIYNMCNSDGTFAQELWDEKITDHINYLLLLQALVREDGI